MSFLVAGMVLTLAARESRFNGAEPEPWREIRPIGRAWVRAPLAWNGVDVVTYFGAQAAGAREVGKLWGGGRVEGKVLPTLGMIAGKALLGWASGRAVRAIDRGGRPGAAKVVSVVACLGPAWGAWTNVREMVD